MLKNLSELEMEENWIYEVLLATKDKQGNVNVAPMGIKRIGDKISIAIYKNSRTYDNIRKTNKAIVNFVPDTLSFYKTREPDDEYLKLADAYLELEVEKITEGDPVTFIFTVPKISGKQPKLINRAESLFLEALIAHSKIPYKEEAKQMFDYYCNTISKVAPDSEYEKTIKKLKNK